jgi:hypothetical protein
VSVVLLLAPALLLAVPLLLRRYLGEEVIERLRLRRSGVPRRRRGPAPPPALRPLARPCPRGAALVAAHLAQRPPPARGA